MEIKEKTENKESKIVDKRANYAQIVSDDECETIWSYLKTQYGIEPKGKYENFGFAKSKKGRIWIATKKALEFIEQERFDPAKVLTIALGKADSKKLLRDQSMLIRLTLDGALFFNDSITKNIIKLKPSEEKLWSAGSKIDYNIENGVYVLASATTNHIIGSTIAKDGILINFVPKWRRFPRPK
jgi:hypothetical protein